MVRPNLELRYHTELRAAEATGQARGRPRQAEATEASGILVVPSQVPTKMVQIQYVQTILDPSLTKYRPIKIAQQRNNDRVSRVLHLQTQTQSPALSVLEPRIHSWSGTAHKQHLYAQH